MKLMLAWADVRDERRHTTKTPMLKRPMSRSFLIRRLALYFWQGLGVYIHLRNSIFNLLKSATGTKMMRRSVERFMVSCNVL